MLLKLILDGRSARVSLPDTATISDLKQEVAKAGGPPRFSLVAPGGVHLSDGLLASHVRSGTAIRVVEAKPLERRVVPADNSCLFTAVSLLTGKSNLREVVAEAVLLDGERWNAGVLEKSPEAYAQYIMDTKTWGGSVELTILAEHASVQLVAVDVENCVPHFHPAEWVGRRAFLLWDGIHYDPLVCGDVTTFDVDDVGALQAALDVAATARRNRQFTNLATFSVRCLVCGAGLTGQQDCVAHAQATGHTNFGENTVR